jgi:hypothetical protein
MSETYEANLSLFPGGARVADVGFRFGAKGTHTSRTMMFEELRQALLATAPEARRGDYAEAIIEGNCLSKPTSSTRRLSNQRLGELYGLDPTIPLFRVLRRLWDIDSGGRPLLALLAAIARDPLLAATCPAIVFLPANADFQRDTMKSALRSVVGNRLNDSTLEKVCRNAASTWAQSGHLEGRWRMPSTSPTRPAFAALKSSHAPGSGCSIAIRRAPGNWLSMRSALACSICAWPVTWLS